MKKRISPALVLLFLAPAVGELLSSSSPPVEFFNPLGLALQVALYGCGALLIREIAFRWRRGWPSIFLLGAAYGILEEGLLCKSFFDPNWMDLGVLGTYGRAAGVNWVWALNLTIYHAFVSITLTIALTELIFPARRNDAWLTRRGMYRAAFFLGLVTIFGYFVLKPTGYPVVFHPPVHYALIALALIVGLVLLARRGPGERKISPDAFTSAPHPGLVWFTGLSLTVMLFAVPETTRKLGAHFTVTMLVTAVVAALLISVVSRWATTDRGWPREGRIVVGLLAMIFLLFLAFGLTVLSLDKLKAFGLLALPVVVTALVLAFRRLRVLLRHEEAWSALHVWALAAGTLTPFIIASFLFEIYNDKRPDNTAGMSVVGVLFAYALYRLWRRLRKAVPPRIPAVVG